MLDKIRLFLFGEDKNPLDRNVFHKITLVAFLAWVGLGADGLSSSSYGPEEAYRALGGQYHHIALYLALAIAATVFIISASYSQIIEFFPSGGGGYVVASKLLNPTAGLISGSALLVDYILYHQPFDRRRSETQFTVSYLMPGPPINFGLKSCWLFC